MTTVAARERRAATPKPAAPAAPPDGREVREEVSGDCGCAQRGRWQKVRTDEVEHGPAETNPSTHEQQASEAVPSGRARRNAPGRSPSVAEEGPEPAPEKVQNQLHCEDLRQNAVKVHRHGA